MKSLDRRIYPCNPRLPVSNATTRLSVAEFRRTPMNSIFSHASGVWGLAIGIPRVMAALAIALACGIPGLARADGGGIEDTSGLVWSPPMGPYTWLQATQAASDYVVTVVTPNGVVQYNDWRLPTRDELKGAWLDGTIPFLVDARNNLDGAYWSSDLYALSKTKRPRSAYYFQWAHIGNGTGGPLYYEFNILQVDGYYLSALFVRGRSPGGRTSPREGPR
jgi:hypothetical protein